MDENKKYNIIKGIAAVLVLFLGLVFFLGFKRGLFGDSFLWVLIAIVGGIVVLLISGILVIPRARIRARPSRIFGVAMKEEYAQFEGKTQSREDKDFIPSQKHKKKIGVETKFCEYCGTVREIGSKFCKSCGRKYN